jgi:hypothetical protein
MTEITDKDKITTKHYRKPVIIFWDAKGRLGNQLFQLAFLKYWLNQNGLKVKSIVFIGNWYQNDIRNYEVKLNVNYMFGKSILFRKFRRPLKYFIRHLAYNQKINQLYQKHNVLDYGVQNTSKPILREYGNNKFIYYSGYFQFGNLPRGLISHVAFKKMQQEKLFLKSKQSIKPRICTIHMRFTDYDELTIFGKKGTILPISYYIAAISKIIKICKSEVKFKVYSDDPIRSQKYISDIKNELSIEIFYINSGNKDMMELGLADYMILSASSYSWWAWYLSNVDPSCVFAPKYWLGFKSDIEEPLGILNKSMQYIGIRANA